MKAPMELPTTRTPRRRAECQRYIWRYAAKRRVAHSPTELYLYCIIKMSHLLVLAFLVSGEYDCIVRRHCFLGRVCLTVLQIAARRTFPKFLQVICA